jgi:hypothetical protein
VKVEFIPKCPEGVNCQKYESITFYYNDNVLYIVDDKKFLEWLTLNNGGVNISDITTYNQKGNILNTDYSPMLNTRTDKYGWNWGNWERAGGTIRNNDRAAGAMTDKYGKDPTGARGRAMIDEKTKAFEDGGLTLGYYQIEPQKNEEKKKIAI